MKIPIGDCLEWIGAGLLVSSAALYAGLVLALAVAGASVVYFANCYADDRLTVGSTTRKENP